jgi:hypothetical protein
VLRYMSAVRTDLALISRLRFSEYLSKRVARCLGAGILWTQSGLSSTRIGAGLCRILDTDFREDLFEDVG